MSSNVISPEGSSIRPQRGQANRLIYRVLSVRQPWASAIFWGHPRKRYENRGKWYGYRGPLLIHAAKSRAHRNILLPGMAPGEFVHLPEQFWHFGALLGWVDLVDCIPAGLVRGQPHVEGPWCLVLDNPRPLRHPIACNGQLSIYRLADELTDLVSPP